jgi:hypothetical protein
LPILFEGGGVMTSNSGIERLAAQLGVKSGSRKIGRTTLVRLTLYYGAVLAIVALLLALTGDPKGFDPASGARRGETVEAAGVTHPGQGFWDPLFRSLPPLGTGAAEVIGAFLLALPAAFTYVRTRSSLKYDQSLVQTVIMLPVVVTAILVVVHNSLALAFSLAGIVAAVRFRNNLKDSRDAVYILAAVGIGFAAGVGRLAIAAFLSIFFCVLELLLWKLDLTAEHERTFGLLCMPPGPSGQRGSAHAMPAATHEATVRTLDIVPAGASADTSLLALEGATPQAEFAKGKRPPERLLVYSTNAEKARRIVDAVLERTTKRFKLKDTRNSGNDQYVLEYHVRIRRKSPASAIIDRIHAEGTPYVIAVEVLASDELGSETNSA